jgi:hypothetical protein
VFAAARRPEGPDMADVVEPVRGDLPPGEVVQQAGIRIYGHSPLFYCWPIWVAGFIIAAVTYLDGIPVQIGDLTERFLPGQAPGVAFTTVLFFVILFTNVMARGMHSVIIVLVLVLAAVVIAYFGWWDNIIRLLPHLSLHMNLGFYVTISSLVFLAWALTFFGYDRLSYWLINPGQITEVHVVGGAEKSYDTRGMVFEKLREDLFRQWLLGFGSGDLHINTMGARREHIVIPNVLFVDSKVQAIQKLIATRPDQFAAPPV